LGKNAIRRIIYIKIFKKVLKIMGANPNRLPNMPGAFSSVNKVNLAKRPSEGEGVTEERRNREDMRRLMQQRAAQEQASRNRERMGQQSGPMRGTFMGPGRAGRFF
jgi:hypothetical protein